MLPVTFDRSEAPAITPCLDSKELQVDSEIINAGLSAISVKGYDAGDPREVEVSSIRHRNSFWCVHRPELSKVRWASNCAPQVIVKCLEECATGCKCPPEEQTRRSAETDQPTVIRATFDECMDDEDEDRSSASESKIIQLLSDHDLASRTILHKCRAKSCVMAETLERRLTNDTRRPCNSKTISEKDTTQEVSCKNNVPSYLKILTALSPNEYVSRKSQMNENLVVLLKPRDERRLSVDGELTDSL